MKRKLITTSDGSHTFFIENWNETYHSKFGAIRESYHVFIDKGFYALPGDISILEMGFGTGLNAFITFLEAEKTQRKIIYESIEAFPLNKDEISGLNYVEQLGVCHFQDIFTAMHECPWDVFVSVSDYFHFKKRLHRFQDTQDSERFNLIYFDAFSTHIQPDLWDYTLFRKMYNALKPSGILVTYACNTPARLAMEKAGFKTEKLTGSLGKREMLRAYKTTS